MVNSIASDEEVDGPEGIAHPLQRRLYGRRSTLCGLDPWASPVFNTVQYELLPDYPGDPEAFFRLGLGHVIPAGPDEGLSSFDYIGRDLSRLVTERDLAGGKRQRNAGQKRIDKYLKKIGVAAPAGRPEEGFPKVILERLFREGRELVDTCWGDVLDEAPSDQTVAWFEEHGVADPDEQQFWSLRFALPVFSSWEIATLGMLWSSRQEWRSRWYRGLTPRRITIWLLAHRFNMSPTSVSAKVGTRSDEFLKGHKSPFLT